MIDLKDQKNAKLSCESIKSSLATINSEEERVFLRDYNLRDTPTSEDLNKWLGGSQRNGIGYWYDLSPFHIVMRDHKLEDNPKFDGIIMDQNAESISINGNRPFNYICQKKLPSSQEIKSD